MSMEKEFFNPRTRDGALDLIMYLAFTEIRSRLPIKKLEASIAKSIFPHLNLFLDIARLYIRIVDDKNAFEGIRLVKYR